MTAIFTALVLLLLTLRLRRRYDWRMAALLALLLTTLLVCAGTEILSLFHMLTPAALRFFWGVAMLAAGAALWHRPPELRFRPMALPWRLLPTALILTITLIAGFSYLPNNYDSMTYHLARVAMWIQERSVGFFPTCIPRQNCQLPLAEYWILHLQLLSGGDQFAFLVQYFSLLYSLLAISVIVRELGGDVKLQHWSILLGATIPMAILQSSSTQNDLVTSLYLLLFVLGMLRLDGSWKRILFPLSALGFALLTKGTAYLYGAGLGLGLGVPLLCKAGKKWKKTLLQLLGIAIGALFFSLPFYCRTMAEYGIPLSGGSDRYFVMADSPAENAVNTLCHLVANAGVPKLHLHEPLVHAMYRIFPKQLKNPALAWPGTHFDIVFSFNEDSAGNLPHFLLFLFAIASITVKGKPAERRYLLALLCGGLLITLLRWQPWLTRLQTPFFLLSVPLLALTLARVKMMLPAMALCCFFYALPFALKGVPRPLLPERKCCDHRIDETSEKQLNAALRLLPDDCRELGFYGDKDSPAYVLFAALDQHGAPGKIRIFYGCGPEYLIGFYRQELPPPSGYLYLSPPGKFRLLKAAGDKREPQPVRHTAAP